MKKPVVILGWAPRSTEEAIVAGAESLVRLGLPKDSGKKLLEKERTVRR